MAIQKMDGGPAVVKPMEKRAITPTSGDRYKKPRAKFDQRLILRSNFSSYPRALRWASSADSGLPFGLLVDMAFLR
jgi:hypothetical protein